MLRLAPAARNTVVGVGVALLISTLGIQASDYLQHGTSSFLASVGSSADCPQHTVAYVIDGQSLCVDVYEASASDACPHQQPTSATANTDNLQATDCRAVSVSGQLPLRYVTYAHAEQFCARAGKRLPTPREWHTLTRDLDMTTGACVVAETSGPVQTGASTCVNDRGVYDLVGNVWEWVDAEIVDGTYNGRALPRAGYVSAVDTSGVVLETTTEPDPLFDEAYAWTSDSGVYGMVRGGFYGSGADAGRYTQNLTVRLDTATPGIGFRCVYDRS